MPFELLVLRDACCAADDQTMPLEMTLEVTSAQTLADVLQAIVRSRFLQFSSTHHTLTVSSGTRKLATVSAQDVREYMLAPDTSIEECLVDTTLTFRFAQGL